MEKQMKNRFSRRDFLKAGGLAVLGTAGVAAVTQVNSKEGHNHTQNVPVKQHDGHGDGLPGTMGEVNHEKNGFNPSDILSDFDYGKVSSLPNGQTLREYNVISINKNIEIVPNIEFAAWTYNGR